MYPAIWLFNKSPSQLYFPGARAALIPIAAPFRGWIVQQTGPATFLSGVLGLERDRSSAQSANVIIRTELSAVITPFSCSADFLCRRDVAQPGRALAWGARGRQFKSARPDHFFVFISIKSRRQIGSHCSRIGLLLSQRRHRQRDIVGPSAYAHSALAGIRRRGTDVSCGRAFRCPEHVAQHAGGCACAVGRDRLHVASG
jgi:hypothetical protein